MASKHIINVTDNNFDKEVVKKSETIPVVVDFWAAWCGPCRILGPSLERIAENAKGKFILAKLDVQSNNEKSEEYDIMSIPAVKLFVDGEVKDEFVGAIPESQIKNWLIKNGIKI